ncbi:MAG TPA: TraB/GumN family protein, partial [Spirochaetota bacterium]|nr:TraB/GumN family protein [Spirochaetota bacterium]
MNSYAAPAVKKHTDNVHLLEFSDKQQLYLIGTAHVSRNSARLVENIIKEVDPDTICVELDSQRYENIKNAASYEKLDIISIIKKKQIFFFAGKLILSSFQKKISDKTGANPGEEFTKALELAESKNKKLVLADRNIGITLKRAWRMTGIWSQLKMFTALLWGEKEGIDEKKLEELKKEDALTVLIEELGTQLPSVKKVLIDERDKYLTGKIQQQLGKTTVAIVGAGHVPGMLEAFKQPVAAEDMRDYDTIPKRFPWFKTFLWIIPLIIISAFIWNFLSSDREMTVAAVKTWIMVNGTLTAAGCILALAHPLVVIAGFLAAPLTSLNPLIGAGIVTGLLQAFLVRPRVIDFINLK